MNKNSPKKPVNVKRMYKLDMKRFALYWIILIPIVFAIGIGLSFTNLQSAIKILIIVGVGLLFCATMELIHIYRLNKNEKSQKPKKLDPFAD